MGLLAEAFNPSLRAESATSDYWYQDPSGFTVAASGGLALSADTILNCGTVLAAVRFRGDSWAMCPPSTYQKTATGRQEMPDHYSQRVLRNPNRWMTGNRWRHLNGVWMATWGNAYSEIVEGRTAFAEELRPLHPSCTRVIDQRGDGSLVYEHTPQGKPRRGLGQEHVLHFRDLSTDGIRGVEMYKLIRNVVSIALLAERHAQTFLKKGARLAGLIVPSGKLDEKQRAELRESINTDLSGASNTGTFGILPFGVDLKPTASTNKDSQLTELSDQVVGSILRFLGVPGVVVGWMGDKTATYASAKEFFESGGLKHCVLPIIINVEAEEEKSLLLADSGLQIKHNLEVLLRASTKDRYEAQFKAAGGPWMSRNEVRRIEDLNEDPDPQMNKILTPVNMSPEVPEDPGPEDPPATPPRRMPEPPPDDEEAQARPVAPVAAEIERLTALLQLSAVELGQVRAMQRDLVQDNARRVLRREAEMIRAKAPKLSRDQDKFRAFVLETYGKHAAYVAETMRIPEGEARAYCERQASELLAGGVAAIEAWEQEVPPRLVALALGCEA